MSNTKYLEIDSTYRDRTLWPLPGQFEIPISQSGRKGRSDASDPVSLATPLTAWTSNRVDANTSGVQVSGTISSTGAIDETSSQSTFIISATAGDLQQAANYYESLTLQTGTIGRRIVSYEYIGTDAGGVNDQARITVSPVFPDSVDVTADAFTINDPTDLSDTSNPLFFIPSGLTGTDRYANCILYNETLDEYRTVTGYDSTTHILTVNATTAVAGWSATDNYSIRKELPILSSAIAASTTSTITLTSGSTVDDIYNNHFVRIRATTYGNSVVDPETTLRRIVAYDGKTQIATITPSYSSAPLVTDIAEILMFSYDNLNPFSYNGGFVSQQEMVCYELELLNLVLPNQTLSVGGGSRIAFYPYVYVQLSNISGAGAGLKSSIYSNNPNATKMLFRAAIDDVPNPVFSSFVKIDGDGMVQTVKFKPNDNLRFSVTLPDGSIFDTTLDENFSPSNPNPLIQISALFSLKRLN